MYTMCVMTLYPTTHRCGLVFPHTTDDDSMFRVQRTSSLPGGPVDSQRLRETNNDDVYRLLTKYK